MRNAIMAAMVLTLATLAQAGGHWRFERTYVDGEETKTADWSGNGNHGVLVNGPTLVAGRVGRGMDFFVEAGAVVTSDGPSITGAITVSVWCYAYSFSSFPVIIGKGSSHAGTDTATANWSMERASSQLLWRMWEDTGIRTILYSGAFFLADEWIHWTVIWDGTTNEDNLRIYKNGALAAQSSQDDVSSLKDGPEPIHIGYDVIRDDARMTWDGVIDEVIITPFAWTAEEVRAYYHSGEVPSRRSE